MATELGSSLESTIVEASIDLVDGRVLDALDAVHESVHGTLQSSFT